MRTSNQIYINNYLYTYIYNGAESTISKISSKTGQIINQLKINEEICYDLYQNYQNFIYFTTNSGILYKIDTNLNIIKTIIFHNESLKESQKPYINQNGNFKILMIMTNQNILISYDNYLLLIDENDKLKYLYFDKNNVLFYSQCQDYYMNNIITHSKGIYIFSDDFQENLYQDLTQNTFSQNQICTSKYIIYSCDNSLKIIDNKTYNLLNKNQYQDVISKISFKDSSDIIVYTKDNYYTLYQIEFLHEKFRQNFEYQRYLLPNIYLNDVNITDKDVYQYNLSNINTAYSSIIISDFKNLGNIGTVFDKKFMILQNSNLKGTHKIELLAITNKGNFKIIFDIKISSTDEFPFLEKYSDSIIINENDNLKYNLAENIINYDILGNISYKIMKNNECNQRLDMLQKTYINNTFSDNGDLYDIFLSENEDALKNVNPQSEQYKIYSKINNTNIKLLDKQEFNKIYYMRICKYDQDVLYYEDSSEIYKFYSIFDKQFIDDGYFIWNPKLESAGDYQFIIRIYNDSVYKEFMLNVTVEKRNVYLDNINIENIFNLMTDVNTDINIKWNIPNVINIKENEKFTIFYDIYFDTLPDPRIYIKNCIDSQINIKSLKPDSVYYIKIRQKLSEKKYVETQIIQFKTKKSQISDLYGGLNNE